MSGTRVLGGGNKRPPTILEAKIRRDSTIVIQHAFQFDLFRGMDFKFPPIIAMQVRLSSLTFRAMRRAGKPDLRLIDLLYLEKRNRQFRH